MTFYKECLGGDLSLKSIGQSPMEMHFPEYFQEKSLIVAYKVHGWIFPLLIGYYLIKSLLMAI
jgi:hypothetical protein